MNAHDSFKEENQKSHMMEDTPHWCFPTVNVWLQLVMPYVGFSQTWQPENATKKSRGLQNVLSQRLFPELFSAFGLKRDSCFGSQPFVMS